jgi:VanZ family protein
MIKKNLFSIVIALIIMYLSLASSNTFEKVPIYNIPYFDKIVHCLMYSGLMASIIFENRKTLNKTSTLFLISLVPLSYGILMEILQGIFTVTRSASLLDAIADAAGILVSIILWLLIKPHIKETVR